VSEVEVLEQLLSSAVQGKGLSVQMAIKQDPTPAAASVIRQSTEQEYGDVYSRVVAARGEENTSRLTNELRTLKQRE
jgi:hypothetical protein